MSSADEGARRPRARAEEHSSQLFSIDNPRPGRDKRFMFVAKHFKDLLEAKPFQPFRIHLSDGSTHDVLNHEAAFVTRNYLEIGLDQDDDKIPGRLVKCSILHITQIEELLAA